MRRVMWMSRHVRDTHVQRESEREREEMTRESARVDHDMRGAAERRQEDRQMADRDIDIDLVQSVYMR